MGNLLIVDDKQIRKLFLASSRGLGPLSGDTHGNRKVSIEDAILILGSAANVAQPDPALKANANVNGDAIINLSDAILMLRKAVGLP